MKKILLTFTSLAIMITANTVFAAEKIPAQCSQQYINVLKEVHKYKGMIYKTTRLALNDCMIKASRGDSSKYSFRLEPRHTAKGSTFRASIKSGNAFTVEHSRFGNTAHKKEIARLTGRATVRPSSASGSRLGAESKQRVNYGWAYKGRSSNRDPKSSALSVKDTFPDKCTSRGMSPCGVAMGTYSDGSLLCAASGSGRGTSLCVSESERVNGVQNMNALLANCEKDGSCQSRKKIMSNAKIQMRDLCRSRTSGTCGSAIESMISSNAAETTALASAQATHGGRAYVNGNNENLPLTADSEKVCEKDIPNYLIKGNKNLADSFTGDGANSDEVKSLDAYKKSSRQWKSLLEVAGKNCGGKSPEDMAKIMGACSEGANRPLSTSNLENKQLYKDLGIENPKPVFKLKEPGPGATVQQKASYAIAKENFEKLVAKNKNKNRKAVGNASQFKSLFCAKDTNDFWKRARRVVSFQSGEKAPAQDKRLQSEIEKTTQEITRAKRVLERNPSLSSSLGGEKGQIAKLEKKLASLNSRSTASTPVRENWFNKCLRQSLKYDESKKSNNILMALKERKADRAYADKAIRDDMKSRNCSWRKVDMTSLSELAKHGGKISFKQKYSAHRDGKSGAARCMVMDSVKALPSTPGFGKRFELKFGLPQEDNHLGKKSSYIVKSLSDLSERFESASIYKCGAATSTSGSSHSVRGVEDEDGPGAAQ